MIDASSGSLIKRGRDLLLHAADVQAEEVWRALDAPATGASSRGQAPRLQVAGRTVVRKHYYRGGLAARLSSDLYLWTGVARARSLHEWTMLSHLRARGMPVPKPVAARVRLTWPWYTADLLTVEIPDTRTLGQLLSERSLPPETWRRVGKMIARLHTARVEHADLNIDNVLLDKDGRVYLIDFDRARPQPIPGDWQAENLRRLERSLLKWVSKGRIASDHIAEFPMLLSGYHSGP